ncbi:putative AbiEii toxin of type IV toxin-antitoxin system [Flavobacterium endophyticum]|uniref:Putative AbiEii toxin of type IV toxin-antitoxin system n=1 Tax=Flavobacterium endophyticum TaxID=1540163 RepID=A0A495MBZ2_9FLAO|nr:AAA family ATPase [Flavobacterium endophyticum]RKS21769.1 putative AbiEii toxin of type IV toxin-antitoxin system [Flavobacterium endophyticum]
MEFEILDKPGNYPPQSKNKVYLTWDNWNDYSYYTTFGIFFVDENSEKHRLGGVMLGFKGQKQLDRVFQVGYSFDYIGDTHFSLGTSEEYYERLNMLPSKIREEILINLNDLARNIELLEGIKHERVFRSSFLRSLSESTITGQYRRMALGGAKLTPYRFLFNQPSANNSSFLKLTFDVEPDSLPPTNIHVLIGRNGVGKTYLINNMIDSLLSDKKEIAKGTFKFEEDIEYSVHDTTFVNLVHVSFSAFDEINLRTKTKVTTKNLRYSYIGLWHYNDGKITIKSPKTLPKEFYDSLCFCKSRGLKNRWIKAVTSLQSDPNFREAGIIELIELDKSRTSTIKIKHTFRALSSGHKIILLTITKLIEELHEKSLIIMDEPEAHLHPPLLSAFIRTMSDLLIDTNGVAIIATHSPVILQEVPKSCAWKIRRSGSLSIAERLPNESFGENIGILTNDIFGLEVMESGFYNLLSSVAEQKKYNYDSVLREFEFQLGMEARSILMSIIANKNNKDA